MSLFLLGLAFKFLVLPEFTIFGVFDTFSELRPARSGSVIGGRPVMVVRYELIVAFEGERARPVVPGYCK